MRGHRHTFLFIVFTTAAASSVSLLGGVGLQAVETELLALVPLVVALPALNTTVGDYSIIIAAHAGDPFERARSRKQLAVALAWSVLINCIGVVLLSLIIASKIGYTPDAWFIAKFALFASLAIILSVAFMFVITFSLDKVLKKAKFNPDDILIPIVTSISDVLMLGFIAAAAYWYF